ncbi:hypothetical protein JXQ31_11090 [candidate division KSB1 bacterium]|nr:hypothetical protein [candidate division KSB1 bacterium]
MMHLFEQKFSYRGWFGLLLLITGWLLNWTLPGLRTHIFFFPMWLGYCLIIDALVFMRKGTSLYTRSIGKYIGLFIISAPAWWLFELINLRTQNWMYVGRQYFTDWEYAIFATLSFSSVIPAVFGTAELAASFKWFNKGKDPHELPGKIRLAVYFLCGWLMLTLLIIRPRYFFPFVWLSVWFILEPVNVWLKNRSLLRKRYGLYWRTVFSLWLGCLICGFFWEMWNFYSYPKWIYQVPFVGFWHVFEMPILGYLGYLPFSMELFALYHLITGLIKPADKQDYVQV